MVGLLFILFFGFVGQMSSPDDVILRPFLSSFRHIPPQKSFVKLGNELFMKKIAAAGEKCLFG